MSEQLALGPGGAVRLESTPDGLGWLVIDLPGQKVNILTGAVLEQIDRALDQAADRSDLRGLVVISGKPGTFIAGADVSEIGGIATAEAGEEAARRGQSILHRFGGLGKPTLAAIDGVCLGGGLELALACDFRLATLAPETKLGLPEVKLGIIPGFGGTQRLPRLIGLTPALDMILTGRNVDAAKAERLGLVDQAVPGPQLRAHAAAWLLHAVEKSRHGHPWSRLRPRRKRPTSVRLMAWPGFRALTFRAARRRLDHMLKGDYPAPYAALEAINASRLRSLEAGLAVEAKQIGPLLVSPTCKNLTWLFGANNEARRDGAVTDAAGRPIAGRSVQRAAVLGAGVMGGGIAHLMAEQGIPVRLKDVNDKALLKGMQAASDLVQAQRRRRRIDRREAERRMARIAPTLAWDGFGGLDIVVEAVVEDLNIKRAVLAEVEARVPESCVFATNTSSLPIAEIAKEARHPGRVVGLHFFNPVHRMPLVEVIAGPASSPEAVAAAHALARRLGKTPVVVKDTPGFLVNRILTAYLAEALKMFVEGTDPLKLDDALEHFGMPMGPFALLDQIGLDTALKASRAIEAVNEKYLPRVSVLPALVDKGRLGVKNGRGFYRYSRRGKKKGFDHAVLKLVERHGPGESNWEEIQARLYLPMVNEAVRCLNAGVARTPADVDLGMVMGTGFPPFRGGPLRNADIFGLPAVVERMNRLAEKHGERLAPHPALVEMALGGRRFYP